METKKWCGVHIWEHFTVEGMKFRFRICKKCDRIEARWLHTKGWFPYKPTDKAGFVNAIRMMDAKSKIKDMLTVKDTEDLTNNL